MLQARFQTALSTTRCLIVVRRWPDCGAIVLCRVPGGHCWQACDSGVDGAVLLCRCCLLRLPPHTAAREVWHRWCALRFPCKPSTFMMYNRPCSFYPLTCARAGFGLDWSSRCGVNTTCADRKAVYSCVNLPDTLVFATAGSRFGDLCTWLWCGPCALCQVRPSMLSNSPPWMR